MGAVTQVIFGDDAVFVEIADFALGFQPAFSFIPGQATAGASEGLSGLIFRLTGGTAACPVQAQLNHVSSRE